MTIPAYRCSNATHLLLHSSRGFIFSLARQMCSMTCLDQLGKLSGYSRLELITALELGSEDLIDRFREFESSHVPKRRRTACMDIVEILNALKSHGSKVTTKYPI